ncbi:LPS export ABC transporter permease LptF [Candidatus Methylomirabilis limnetica]|uniref:LPS export ABC transporter permease LptF n=2 Tax=Candidatus Methylomirabilis limnetica TaxID=2033718 RepID=A0A2T4TXM4_9BACT|nr:LPS export ABC transporter permease LptF [Candidatus Methylomirabilis limnetica]
MQEELPMTHDTSPAAIAMAEQIAELQERVLDDALGPRGHPRSSEAPWACRCGARTGFARRGGRHQLLRTDSGAVSITLYVVRCSSCRAVFSPFRQLIELASHGDRPEEILKHLRSLPPLRLHSGQALRPGSGQVLTKDLDDSKTSPPRRADVAIALTRRLRPFSLIDRYLLREMAASFALGLATFTFVLLMDQMMRLMDLIINKGAPVWVVLRLIFYVLPFSLTVTIPMSVLLAVLATYGRVSSEGEAIVLKTSGLSLYRLMAPAVLFGIVATLATLWISALVQPDSTRASKTLIHQLYQTKALTSLEEGVFNTEYQGLAIYVDHLKKQDGTFQGILVIDRRSQTDQHLIIAQEGKLLTRNGEADTLIGLQVSNGNLHISSRDDPGRYRNLDFETYDLQVPASDTLAEAAGRVKQGKEMNLGELRAQIARLEKDGDKAAWPLQVELHKKFSLPIACLILSAIGAPLAIRIKKASRGVSLALSVAIAVFYYILLATGESLGSRGQIEPALGVWFPNLTIGIIAISLVLAEGREAFLPARLRTAIRTLMVFLSRAISQQKTAKPDRYLT